MLQKIYDGALPRLQGKKIKDICIGIELLGVQLEDGEIGIAYVLKNEIGCASASLPNKGIEGMEAEEAAALMVKRNNPLAAALGIATCNAVADYDSLSSRTLDAADVFDTRPDDVAGMIGNIKPVAKQLKSRVGRMIIFDRADHKKVYPEEEQEELLPQCDLIVITSSALLNGTFSEVISYCSGAREIVLTGATTPMYPDVFRDTGVTVLAGSRWLPEHKEQIFNAISKGGCLREIMPYGEKLAVRL